MTYSPKFNPVCSDSDVFRVGTDPIRPDAKPVWKMKVAASEFACQTVFDKGIAIVLTHLDTIKGIRLSDGEVLWQIEEPTCTDKRATGSIVGPKLRARDGKVLVLGSVEAELDATTGVQLELLDRDASQEPPDGLIWKFGNYRARCIDGWEPNRGKWFHRATGKWSDRPPWDKPHDQASRDRHITNSPGEARVFLSKHPSDLEDLGEASVQNLKTGEILWKRTVSKESDGITRNGKAHAASDVVLLTRGSPPGEPPMMALDLETGEELWRGLGNICETHEFWPSACWSPTDADRDAGEGLLVLRYNANCESLGSPERNGASYYLECLHPRTGEATWSTVDTLPTTYASDAQLENGVLPLARAGSTLWVKHRFANDFSSKETPYKTIRKPKIKSQLVALDYRSGEILHRQTIAKSAKVVGQHGGKLLIRQGTTLTCFA